MIKYRIIDNLGMYGIKPLNQESHDFLVENVSIPTYCWLGNTCHVDQVAMQQILNHLEGYDGITLVTDDGEFVSASNRN